MKKSVLIGVLCMMVLFIPIMNCGLNAESKQQTKKISYTTLDVKHDYEIVQVITGFSEINNAASKDSFLKAYGTAWANMTVEANNLNVDAVIGIHVEFAASGDNLRIIVYGTAVKYK